jgi:DnaJ-domain-containing protein 1
MAKLRLTHVVRDETGDGYYIRFTSGWDEAGQEAWHSFKYKLKSSPLHAAWHARFKFNDGKVGAWWISEFLLEWSSGEFSNYDDAMEQCEDPLKAFKERLRRDMLQLAIPAHIRQALQTLDFPPDKLPSVEQIKKQYRALAFACHPDRTKGYDDRIKAVNNANDILQSWLKERRA